MLLHLLLDLTAAPVRSYYDSSYYILLLLMLDHTPAPGESPPGLKSLTEPWVSHLKHFPKFSMGMALNGRHTTCSTYI